jgi:hypothetical protein
MKQGFEMSNKKAVLTGLAQALATLAVCAVAVLMAERLQQLEDPNDGYLDSVALLLLFVTSALVCGAIVLAYPAYLLLRLRLREGYLLLLSTIGWLVAMLGSVLAVIAFTELRLHLPF